MIPGNDDRYAWNYVKQTLEMISKQILLFGWTRPELHVDAIMDGKGKREKCQRKSAERLKFRHQAEAEIWLIQKFLSCLHADCSTEFLSCLEFHFLILY